ncbi:hypothetical protein MSPP1_002677 [Malassezia sp. CBS 17886]|nr:hypothetical protein MSPP1_002677 [Malassezia sp. CBS 17886]
MHKLINKVHDKFDEMTVGGMQPEHLPAVPPLNAPMPPKMLYRYRKQRGVNLGSWFSLENWLTPSLFAHAVAPKASEHDVVKGMSPQDAKQMLEKHWDNFITDSDWKWMGAHGVNSVRLPIGYFHMLAGFEPESVRALLKGTDYADYASVYAGAWPRILAAIEKAASYNIGVLVDLHAVPGSQNKDSHSGLSGGAVGFWHGHHAKSNQKKTIDILVALAESIAKYDNVVGLELMNEPENNPGLQEFYKKAISAIRRCKNDELAMLPIYLGDGWATMHFANWIGNHQSWHNFLVLDHHLYRCFTKKDHNTSPEELVQRLTPGEHGATANFLQRASEAAKGSIIVGEWSGALNPHSFQLSSIQSKLEARKQYTHAEWRAFEKYTAGYFFWTLKKEGGPDPGWCLFTAIEKGSMPPSLDPLQAAGHRPPSLNDLNAYLQRVMPVAVRNHTQYWENTGGSYEPWRFQDGFSQAWIDSIAFLQARAEVGFKAELASVRLAAHDQAKGQSPLSWEFTHGYMQGADEFTRAIYGQSQGAAA